MLLLTARNDVVNGCDRINVDLRFGEDFFPKNSQAAAERAIKKAITGCVRVTLSRKGCQVAITGDKVTAAIDEGQDAVNSLGRDVQKEATAALEPFLT